MAAGEGGAGEGDHDDEDGGSRQGSGDDDDDGYDDDNDVSDHSGGAVASVGGIEAAVARGRESLSFRPLPLLSLPPTTTQPCSGRRELRARHSRPPVIVWQKDTGLGCQRRLLLGWWDHRGYCTYLAGLERWPHPLY